MKQVGIGTRTINFLVDTFIIGILSFIANRTWMFYVVYWNFTYINPLQWFACILFIYYLVFESIWARTPGKWLTYSKVVDKKELKPNFVKIFLRSIVRLTVIDCFFIPFLDKTLHDYLSGTSVVEI